ncbi:hypothetical protein E2562_004779 [Oryza meyeriana var. granulata]|uniref:Uncharacterized protein n=1 Tax=Oryza meyeriana var. granulata TaxID=110450 RepID=A0A6G1DF33_9ORYZ|nr:hypothetical protein E2562_004779 [Oryza meyeriana var. granulata]
MVMSASGRPRHSPATSLASPAIAGWDATVEAVAFISKSVHASSGFRHSTLTTRSAFILPQTISNLVVSTTFRRRSLPAPSG